MAEYLIYFNAEWCGDHPAEWYQSRVEPSVAVTREMKEAGVWIFGGGLEDDHPVYSADATSGTTLITDGPYVETKEHLGGFCAIDVPDDATAKMWAGRVAEACGWPQEVRRFMPPPSV